MAFLQDGRELNERISNSTDQLVQEVLIQVTIIISIITVLLIIAAVWRVKRLAFKMTANIISLYETLYEINIERKGKKGAVELSYKETSKELNELHLTFNRVARTINLASETMKEKLTEEQQA